MPSLILTDTVASLAELTRIVEERQHEEPIPVELESLRR